MLQMSQIRQGTLPQSDGLEAGEGGGGGGAWRKVRRNVEGEEGASALRNPSGASPAAFQEPFWFSSGACPGRLISPFGDICQRSPVAKSGLRTTITGKDGDD